MFFTAFVHFEDLEIIQTQNRRPNNINGKPCSKVTKLKSKFSLILGRLNQVLSNPAQEFHFTAWLHLYNSSDVLII